MLKIFVEHKRRINEALNTPCEGIFWVINDKLIAFTEQVDTTGKWSTDLEHSKLWTELKHKYLVNGKEVTYDYYPRGRVMVNAINDADGKFKNYDVYIYIDNCLNDEETLEDIKYEFRLNNSKCILQYVGSDGGITSNHYICHNCKSS